MHVYRDGETAWVVLNHFIRHHGCAVLCPPFSLCCVKLLACLLFAGFLHAQSFVLDNEVGHLVAKSAGLVQKVSSELFDKTGVSFVLFLKDSPDTLDKAGRLAYQQVKLKALHPLCHPFCPL